MGVVIIALGVPGSEKTEEMRKRFPEAHRIGTEFVPDEIVFAGDLPKDDAHTRCRREFMKALGEGRALVLVDHVYSNHEEVTWYAATAETFGCGVEIDYVSCDLLAAKARTHGAMDEKTFCLLAALMTGEVLPKVPRVEIRHA